jgi:hypothetical protein
MHMKKVRQLIRESAFRIARNDLALFLKDHEEHLLTIFREEMQLLDDEIPEENLFIDIKLVPLGEAILKSALRAITRFLTEDYDLTTNKSTIPISSDKTAPVSLIDD